LAPASPACRAGSFIAKVSKAKGGTGMPQLKQLLGVMLLGLCSQFAIAEPQSPAEYFGYATGEWHLRHDQIQAYLQQLAAGSERAQFEQIGRTHEQRSLIQLVISAPENLARLEQIRQQHLAQLNAGTELSADIPLIVWLGYGVHGNESSGPNAAVDVAYYLLTSQDAEVQNWLKNAVILLQPSLNPDGLDRFANWANMHKALSPVADPQSREHVEPWPNGRPNHYWFDLNRDWLPLQHPESQARIEQYYRWRPAVLADFHEMGPNGSYFFQPGIPSRTYPLTPARNQQLTGELAKFHAQSFDQHQKLYYTEESFDDFYVGKGSTYPDVNGSIGILFEQASSRGHRQDTINGSLSFATTIENQRLTSLSTLRGAVSQKKALQQYQQAFFRESERLAADETSKGFIIAERYDQSRLEALLALLSKHRIKAYALTEKWQHQGQSYAPGQAYFVPLQQQQYLLLKAAFSTEKEFPDNTFYDVSAWTLPYAYNIDFTKVNRLPAIQQQAWQSGATVPAIPAPVAGAYAYAFDWADQKAPRLLQNLLQQGLTVQSASHSFTAVTPNGEQAFAAGTMVVTAALQQQTDWFERLGRVLQHVTLPVYAIKTGLTLKGQDLGSSGFMVMKPPQVLVIAGPGINSTEAGELWFNLEQLADLSPSLIEPQRLDFVDLTRYSHILLPDGQYSELTAEAQQKLLNWVRLGGVIWGQKGGAAWLSRAGLLKAKLISAAEMAAAIPADELSYANKEEIAGKRRIAGAIFQAELDLSHPLTFGLSRAQLPLFKNSSQLLQPSEQAFSNVGLYAQRPQLAGYTAAEYVERIAGSAALVAHNLGQGRVIAMTDNPVFRGYFVGSTRLLINSLYLSKMFSSQLSAEVAVEE